MAVLDEPDAQPSLAAWGIPGAVLLGGVGGYDRLAFGILRMHAEGGHVQQIAARYAGFGERRCGHALAPIAGEGLVLVDDLCDGLRRGGTIVALRVFAIGRFRGGIFAGVIPGHLGDIGHLRVNGIGQPPGEAVKALEVRRAGLPGLDGLRQVQVVGIVIFRAAAVAFEPRAAPIFAVTINGPALAAGRVFGNGGTDDVRRQAGNVFGVNAPAGHCHPDLRGALLDRLVEGIEHIMPHLVAGLVFKDALGLEAQQVIQVRVISDDLAHARRHQLRVVRPDLLLLQLGWQQVDIQAQADLHTARVGVGNDFLKLRHAFAEGLLVGETLVVPGTVRAEVVIVEQVGSAEAVLVRVPTRPAAPGMAAAGRRHPDARGDAVMRHVVEHLVVAGFAVIVVDVEEIHPHLGHLVEDELPILPRIGRGRLRKVRPRQHAPDGYGGFLALVHVWQLQRRLLVRHDIASQVEANAVIIFEQAIHAIEAADFVPRRNHQHRRAR